MLFIILLILFACIAYLVLTYYRLLDQVEAIQNHQQEMDYLLNKRFKLLESLSETKEEKIINLEKNLIYIKQAYNDSIEIYNLNKSIFPANLLVPYFSKLNIKFSILE